MPSSAVEFRVPSPIPPETDITAKRVVNSAYTVHRVLGPGLIEHVYEVCFVHEMQKSGLSVARQVALPITYGELRIEAGLRLDMVVNDCLIVELKAVEKILAVHTAQLLTYLKLTGHRLGLLINFNTALLTDGVKRVAL